MNASISIGGLRHLAAAGAHIMHVIDEETAAVDGAWQQQRGAELHPERLNSQGDAHVRMRSAGYV